MSFPKKFYWDLSDFPEFIKKELKKRQDNSSGRFLYSEEENNLYTEPMSIWTRVCSNGMSDTHEGFIMGGLKSSGYRNTYGLNPEINASVLGYDCKGKLHVVENERYKNRPSPGITSIDSELSGGDGKFRIVTIKWVCWSLDQLHYMTPYFLTSGVSVSIEFGWNSTNGSFLLPVSNASEMLKYFINSDKDKSIMTLVEKSNGNYDASIGTISDFDYSIRQDGGFNCVTVVKNVGGYFSGVYSDSRTSKETEDATKQSKELKELINTAFNYVPSFARNLHTKVEGSGRTTTTSINKERGNSITKQVFYPRDNSNKERIKTQGQPRDYDFDKSSNLWWMSFGYFIKLLSQKCAVKASSTAELFKIDIDHSVISAHPNLTSNNGRVLLIPSTTYPQILLANNDNKVPLKDDLNDQDENLKEANQILRNQKKGFFKQGTWAYVTRLNVNEIINWWSDNKSELAFPSMSQTDSDCKKPHFTGYLKNLYISNEVVKEAVEKHTTFKDIITYVLEQMSKSAGDIWSFQFAPLKSDGNDNGTMTIIDRNLVNGFSTKNIFNFKINSPDSVVKNINFSVKSSDAISAQTLFGGSDNTIGEVKINTDGVSQDFKLPIGLTKRDRLIKDVQPLPATELEKSKSVDSTTSSTINERIPAKESTKFMFYTKNNKDTFILVEPVESIQRGLIYSGNSELRYSAVQPGVKIEINIQGISGIVNLNTFTVSELPSPYGDKCFFQVENVKHTVVNGNWETTVIAATRLKPELAK